MDKERLQKILSMAGLGSRREMEKWIENGWVKVNGKLAKLGDSATDQDKLTVKGKLLNNPLKQKSSCRVLLYHKPVGEISSRSDPNHEKTVFDNLPKLRRSRWIQVGRLDINTSGLMIFTNDGNLANRMMHPSFGLEREYAVRVHGQVTDEMVATLKKEVALEDGPAQFLSVFYSGGEGQNSWYHVVLNEGRNRIVRRLWASQGVEVSRLIRIRYGDIKLPRFLARGKTYELSASEVAQLLKTLPNPEA